MQCINYIHLPTPFPNSTWAHPFPCDSILISRPLFQNKPLNPVCAAQAWGCGPFLAGGQHTWGATPLQRTDSSSLRGCQLSTVPQGWSSMDLFLHSARMLSGLISCRSCARSHSCCDFTHSGVQILLCPEDTVLLEFPCFLPPFLFWF